MSGILKGIEIAWYLLYVHYTQIAIVLLTWDMRDCDLVGSLINKDKTTIS